MSGVPGSIAAYTPNTRFVSTIFSITFDTKFGVDMNIGDYLIV